jgi:predicted transcriptional regulator
MILKKIKKFFYNKKLEKKIKYVQDFMCGRSSHKVFDPELDDMIKDIEDYMKNSGKFSYVEYVTTMNGLYYHRNINKCAEEAIIKVFAEDLKSKESNIKETQNAICGAIERSKKDVE